MRVLQPSATHRRFWQTCLFTIFPNISTTISGSPFWENREKAGLCVKNGGELPTDVCEPLSLLLPSEVERRKSCGLAFVSTFNNSPSKTDVRPLNISKMKVIKGTVAFRKRPLDGLWLILSSVENCFENPHYISRRQLIPTFWQICLFAIFPKLFHDSWLK